MMQKILLFLFLMVGAVTVQAQSLKDLLYSGRLKTDSNTVVRKTDDLKAKTDTVQKKPVVDTAKVSPAAPADSAKRAAVKKDSVITGASAVNSAVITGVGSVATTEEVETAAPIAAAPVSVKSNTKRWKEYTDSLVTTLKPEIDNAKKIKKETYYVLVAYEIDTNGQVSFANVGVTPANDQLQAQIRQYLDGTSLQLTPVLDSTGKPRKVKRSGSFTITKE
jgi:hypothetical protein